MFLPRRDIAFGGMLVLYQLFFFSPSLLFLYKLLCCTIREYLFCFHHSINRKATIFWGWSRSIDGAGLLSMPGRPTNLPQIRARTNCILKKVRVGSLGHGVSPYHHYTFSDIIFL